jgi:hypothetical protein
LSYEPLHPVFLALRTGPPRHYYQPSSWLLPGGFA